MNKIGKIFIFIGITLLSISLLIYIKNNQEEYLAAKKSKEVLDIIKQELKEQEETNSLFNDPETITMKTTNINGYDYIGTLSIPRINLELPVISDYDYQKLKTSPCRYYGNIYTNDLIICGHSYKNHFKYLSNLNKEDIIIFTDINGVNYIYEVKEIEILNPKDVSKMINTEFDLTLYTCTNDGLNRITIRCNKILGQN